MIIAPFAALITGAALTLGATASAAPDIDRSLLTWCQITPAAGASVTLITADGLHRSIADSVRLVFTPAEIAAVQHGTDVVMVDMTCTPLEPIGWAQLGPATGVVVDLPTDEQPVPVVHADPGADPAEVALSPAPGAVAVGLIPAADAEAAPEPVASTVPQAAVSVPQPVDTVPTTAAPAVHASIIGRARALAVAALQAVV